MNLHDTLLQIAQENSNPVLFVVIPSILCCFLGVLVALLFHTCTVKPGNPERPGVFFLIVATSVLPGIGIGIHAYHNNIKNNAQLAETALQHKFEVTAPSSDELDNLIHEENIEVGGLVPHTTDKVFCITGDLTAPTTENILGKNITSAAKTYTFLVSLDQAKRISQAMKNDPDAATQRAASQFVSSGFLDTQMFVTQHLPPTDKAVRVTH